MSSDKVAEISQCKLPSTNAKANVQSPSSVVPVLPAVMINNNDKQSQMKVVEVKSTTIPTPFIDAEVVMHIDGDSKNNMQSSISTPIRSSLQCRDDMQQCWSTGKLTARLPSGETEWYLNLRQQLFDDLLYNLPNMIESLQEQSSMTAGSPVLPAENKYLEQLQKEHKQFREEHFKYKETINGYKKQVETWTAKVKTLIKTFTTIEEKVDMLVKKQKDQEKKVNSKIKNYTEMETKFKKEMSEIEELKSSLQTYKDSEEIQEISKAQEFVSDKYDEILTKAKEIDSKFATNATTQQTINTQIEEIHKKLEINIKHTEQNRKYNQRDCLEVMGVPRFKNENCKEMIQNICKELHLILPNNAISTAHRLGQHPNKTGPPPIIVKFALRDIRNDVFDLKGAAREKVTWRSYGIQTLFINESLTPQKKKLLYNTKVFKREMFRVHGKIYVWTYKGDIYVRKDGEGNPRIRITSDNDLDKLRKGDISMDADVNSVDNIIQREEIISDVNLTNERVIEVCNTT